jgi:hypothetical protein
MNVCVSSSPPKLLLRNDILQQPLTMMAPYTLNSIQNMVNSLKPLISCFRSPLIHIITFIYIYIFKICVCLFGCDHTLTLPNCEPFAFLIMLESPWWGGEHVWWFTIFGATKQKIEGGEGWVTLLYLLGTPHV